MPFRNSLKFCRRGMNCSVVCRKPYKYNLPLIVTPEISFTLTGMLSKSKGLILRVAAGFHALFHLGHPASIPTEISHEAMIAATDFVDMCTQHAAFMAGRGDINEYVQRLSTGINILILLYSLWCGTVQCPLAACRERQGDIWW